MPVYFFKGTRFPVQLILAILLLAVCNMLYASHITGGEMTYKYLGNNYYRISLSIYEDCLNGSPDAVLQDDPAYIRIFDGNLGLGNNTPYYPSVLDSINGFPTDSIHYDINDPNANFVVPVNHPVANQTIINPPATCIRRKTFVKDYYLPANPQGYIVVYQRCCRAASINNITNPSAIGATYYCLIPPSGLVSSNNSAVFKNYPPQIICLNEQMVYDHSATDADGDSLSYNFALAYAGGDQSNSKPIPGRPPYPAVHYSPPFSYSDPMAGSPQIQIDPNTGIISGTPDLLGRYVVTVNCNEWRNGVMINTIMREFLFIVTPCSYENNNNNNTPVSIVDGLYIANAFTPNNDGRNDVFLPVFQDQKAFTLKYMKIFDRYGHMIFNDARGWDGTYKGINQEIGVYIYKIQFEDNTGKNVTTVGNVTLIR